MHSPMNQRAMKTTRQDDAPQQPLLLARSGLIARMTAAAAAPSAPPPPSEADRKMHRAAGMTLSACTDSRAATSIVLDAYARIAFPHDANVVDRATVAVMANLTLHIAVKNAAASHSGVKNAAASHSGVKNAAFHRLHALVMATAALEMAAISTADGACAIEGKDTRIRQLLDEELGCGGGDAHVCKTLVFEFTGMDPQIVALPAALDAMVSAFTAAMREAFMDAVFKGGRRHFWRHLRDAVGKPMRECGGVLIDPYRINDEFADWVAARAACRVAMQLYDKLIHNKRAMVEMERAVIGALRWTPAQISGSNAVMATHIRELADMEAHMVTLTITLGAMDSERRQQVTEKQQHDTWPYDAARHHGTEDEMVLCVERAAVRVSAHPASLVCRDQERLAASVVRTVFAIARMHEPAPHRAMPPGYQQIIASADGAADGCGDTSRIVQIWRDVAALA
jgi:hypothetical protein